MTLLVALLALLLTGCGETASERNAPVMPAGHDFDPLGTRVRDPHPMGWIGRDGHGAAARSNLRTCAGCHGQDERAICVACHQFGGVGGNPHGAGEVTDLESIASCTPCHEHDPSPAVAAYLLAHGEKPPPPTPVDCGFCHET